MRETRERLTYVFDLQVAIEADDLLSAESTLGLVLNRIATMDHDVVTVSRKNLGSRIRPHPAARATTEQGR